MERPQRTEPPRVGDGREGGLGIGMPSYVPTTRRCARCRELCLHAAESKPTLGAVMRQALPFLVLCWLLVFSAGGSAVVGTSPESAQIGTNSPPSTPPFSFIAIGCMPYARLPGSMDAYGRVLNEIERHQPVFTVHLGDIMGGEEICTDALLEKRRQEFDSISPALVFTPGDNEWTDVHRTGKFQPLERLHRIRELFFPTEFSRGRRPLALVTQRRSTAFSKFVENARWTHGGILFATVHVVGSGNNYQPMVPGAVEEWKERDEANAAWLREAFLEAKSIHAAGVAVFCQANPIPDHIGFARFLDTLAAESNAFGKPVLLVHADEHRYRFEVGYRPKKSAPPVVNLTRVETFGASDFHGVLVTVDPTSNAVFLPGPLIVPGNPLPRLPRPPAPPPKPAAP